MTLWTLFLGNAWVVFDLTDSSRWVGATAFATLFPFLLSPLGGIVADRFERSQVLRVARSGSVIMTALILLLALSGAIEAWMVIVVALLQGLGRSVEMPAEQALLPNLVPTESIANAVVLNTTSRLGSRAVGPLLAGPLLAGIGVEGAYAIALVFAVLSYVMLFGIQHRSTGGVSDLRLALDGFREGFRYVKSNGPVLSVFAIVVAHCTLTMSFDALLPGLADNDLNSPTNGYTILVVSVGVGAFLGTFGLAMASNRGRGMVFLVTGAASGISPVLLGLSGSMPPGALGAATMGASQAMFMALAAVFLQEAVDDAVRGRVMSLYGMSAGGIMAVANFWYGAMSDEWGAPTMLIIPGLAFVAIVFASMAVGPHLRRIYGTGVMVRPEAA